MHLLIEVIESILGKNIVYFDKISVEFLYVIGLYSKNWVLAESIYMNSEYKNNLKVWRNLFIYAIKHTSTSPHFAIIFMFLLNASSKIDVK